MILNWDINEFKNLPRFPFLTAPMACSNQIYLYQKLTFSYNALMNWIKMSFNIFFICSLGYHNLDYGKIESIFGRALFRLTGTTQMSWKT